MFEESFKLSLARAEKIMKKVPPYYLWDCTVCDFAIKVNEESLDIVIHMDEGDVYMCTKCFLDLRRRYMQDWKPFKRPW